MRVFILLIGIMVMAAAARADTFEWSDSQGGVHFTDDFDNIPARYKSKARKVDVEPVLQKEEQTSEPAAESETQTTENLYGGHDELWWRSSFKGLRDEMKTIQEGLPEKRDKLDELRRKLYIFSKPSGRIAYNGMYKEIKNDEARIVELQKKLADLDNEAAKAGVPLEWRQ
jgi:hypothetical protein